MQTSKFCGFATFWGFNSIVHFLFACPKENEPKEKGTTNKSSFSPQKKPQPAP